MNQARLYCKQKERIRRLKLRKYFDLEELKRAGLLLDEKMQNAYDKRQIEYEKILERNKEIMRKAEADKKKKELEKVEEPDMWEKEEVAEKQKQKALL